MMRCSRLPPLASPVFNAFRQCWIPAISISHNLNLHSASIYASFSSYVSKSFKHVKPLWIRPMSLHRPSFKVTGQFRCFFRDSIYPLLILRFVEMRLEFQFVPSLTSRRDVCGTVLFVSHLVRSVRCVSSFPELQTYISFLR